MLFEMLLIMVIVTMIFESGWWDSLDSYVNSKFKFYHLPHVFMCSFCQTWWLCLLYLLITGGLSLYSIALALVVANLSEFTMGLLKTLKNGLLSLLDLINIK